MNYERETNSSKTQSQVITLGISVVAFTPYLLCFKGKFNRSEADRLANLGSGSGTVSTETSPSQNNVGRTRSDSSNKGPQPLHLRCIVLHI